MKTKDISDYDKSDFFCIKILFIVLIKNIMMFFNQIINDDVNDVIFLRWKKIDYKVYNDVSSTLFQNEQWN